MIKKTLICFFVLGLSSSVFAAQTTLTDMPSLKVGNAINVIGTNVQGNTTKQNAMNTELYAADALKANTSCFGSEAAFNACFPLDWPTGGSMTWPASDSAYYAARNGAWTSLAGVFASPLGADDNYVTDAEKIKLGNLSGTNTGDQTTITGNAGTATALAANGTNCSAGQAPLGIDASGNAEGCWTPTSGSASAAVDVTVADSGGYWTATTVEGIFAEIGALPGLAFDTDDFIETTASGTTTVSLEHKLIATNTTALGTTAIASGTCATVVSATATGVVAGTPAIWGPTVDWTTVTGYAPTLTGWLIVGNYQTTDTVNFKVCNYTNASITPGAMSIKWQVWQ